MKPATSMNPAARGAAGPRRTRWPQRLALALLAALPALADAEPAGSIANATRLAYGQPLPGLSEAQLQAFYRGRSLFHQSWVVSPAKDTAVDGLGPLYNRLACVSCHPKDGRGEAPDEPEQRMLSMLVRLSVPGRGPHGGPKPHPAYGDQFNEEGIPGVPGEGIAHLAWEEVDLALPDGGHARLRRPQLAFSDLAYGPLEPVLTSLRVGPPVFGLGLLQAVPVQALREIAAEAKPDGVRGRLNRVWNPATRRMEPGRFGLKANMPDIPAQIAGAMHGDLGITSSQHPAENCMPAQTACKAAPNGGKPELTDAQLADLTAYFRTLAVPARREPADIRVRQGEAVFAQAGCALCHRPTLPLGRDAPLPALAGRDIAPYTDLLLHDMGPGLADGRPDFAAGPRDWRTPPLWGIGLTGKINEHTHFLHDGRARNLEEAILWHGGEAQAARDRYARLPAGDKAALLRFLNSL